MKLRNKKIFNNNNYINNLDTDDNYMNGLDSDYFENELFESDLDTITESDVDTYSNNNSDDYSDDDRDNDSDDYSDDYSDDETNNYLSNLKFNNKSKGKDIELSRSISKYFNFDEEDKKYFKQLDKSQKDKIIEIKDTFDKHIVDVKPTIFKILESNIPIESKIEIIKKYKESRMLDNSSTEYYKLNHYINGILRIPFKRFNDLSIDSPLEYIKNSKEKLDKVVFGHNAVKIHILEILGQYISSPKSSGNIFGIYGPMGIGKTTLIKDGLSDILKRPFNFITLGGATDSSFLDGHSYTYEGSKYGKIIECLTKSKCMNPIFYFDELDKISNTARGDEITNLLIHLTDDSQNDKFQDKFYTGINIDLSRAIFVFSFNDIEKVNPILKDRLNIIKLNGFNSKEKITIANDFIIKTIFDEFNINNAEFTTECIQYIIEEYSKEKGVRELKRKLKEIISKINLIKLSGKEVLKINSKIDFKKRIIIDVITAKTLLKN